MFDSTEVVKTSSVCICFHVNDYYFFRLNMNPNVIIQFLQMVLEAMDPVNISVCIDFV